MSSILKDTIKAECETFQKFYDEKFPQSNEDEKIKLNKTLENFKNFKELIFKLFELDKDFINEIIFVLGGIILEAKKNFNYKS